MSETELAQNVGRNRDPDCFSCSSCYDNVLQYEQQQEQENKIEGSDS